MEKQMLQLFNLLHLLVKISRVLQSFYRQSQVPSSLSSTKGSHRTSCGWERKDFFKEAPPWNTHGIRGAQALLLSPPPPLPGFQLAAWTLHCTEHWDSSQVLWVLVSQGENSSRSAMQREWQSKIAYDLSPLDSSDCLGRGVAQAAVITTCNVFLWHASKIVAVVTYFCNYLIILEPNCFKSRQLLQNQWKAKHYKVIKNYIATIWKA